VGGGAVTSGLGTMAIGANGLLTATAGNGLTAARLIAPKAGLIARTGASMADAGGMGAFSGAMEGNGLKERAANAVQGGVAGLIVGGAVPLAWSAGKGTIWDPIARNIMARANPEGFAQSEVVRAVHESGISPQQIESAVGTARNEGQGVFTVADAMGNAGQRMLSTAARTPGAGRTAVVDALEGRQGTQGRRISNALAEGFDAPEPADRWPIEPDRFQLYAGNPR
jgi:hypothetical protein